MRGAERLAAGQAVKVIATRPAAPRSGHPGSRPQQREQRVLQRRPRRQLVCASPGNSGEVCQRRGAWRMSSPMRRTENTRRRRSAADAAGGMQRQHVEAHRVTGLQLPAEDAVRVALRLDVRQIRKAAFGKPLRLRIHEGARHQPRPAVRAGDELQRRLRGAPGPPESRNCSSARPRCCSRAGPGARACARACRVPWSACDRGTGVPARLPISAAADLAQR